jgi:hypothetical protein
MACSCTPATGSIAPGLKDSYLGFLWKTLLVGIALGLGQLLLDSIQPRDALQRLLGDLAGARQ